MLQEVCKLLHVKKTRTTPLHPQSDGMVERLNRTVEAQLVSENQRDWDLHVPFLLIAHRSAVHDTRKCTPAELMFGRNPRLPVDLHYGQPEEEKQVAAAPYVAQLQARIDKVHQHTRKSIQIATDRMKQYYDTKANARPFQPGQSVWLHNPKWKKGVLPKLAMGRVVPSIRHILYWIQWGPGSKPKIVHHSSQQALEVYWPGAISCQLQEPRSILRSTLPSRAAPSELSAGT